MTRLSAALVLLALAAFAGCGRAEGVKRVTEARVQWEGREAEGWLSVQAPGYVGKPLGARVAVIDWTLPATTEPGLNIGFVPRREFKFQLDDLPPIELRPTWTLIPVPPDGQPHRVRAWALPHQMVGVGALAYGPGASTLYAEMLDAGPSVAVASALFVLGLGLMLLSIRARAPVPMRAIAGLALCLAVIDFQENDIASALFGIPVFTWFALHELAMLLPPVCVAAFIRSTLGDTKRNLLLWISRLVWSVAVAEVVLTGMGSMLAAALRTPVFVITLATLVVAGAVAWREAKAGSKLARNVVVGLGLLVVLVIPGMLEAINLLPGAGFNFARFGVLSFLASIGYALVVADRDKTESLRLRVAELERARAEVESLNQELRRQVADKSRALATSVEASVSASSSQRGRLPAVGEIFDDRYVVLRLIGRGGMGAVFEVRRIADKKPYALKLMAGHTDAEMAGRFLREAEIAARIHHPNLVSVIDVGATSNTGVLFLVMELVAGWSLDRLEEKWKLRPWALEVLLQIARGMRALHKEGVVHRDLKPANVVVADGAAGEPLVKLTDFGIAHQTPEGRALAETLPPNALEGGKLTRAGTTMGTPQYMAPDLVGAAHATTPDADAFSFGVMACELLCGSYPFILPPALEVMAGRKPGPADAAFLRSSGLPQRLQELIERCLSLEPRQRPEAGDLIAALDEALEQAVAAAETRQTGVR